MHMSNLYIVLLSGSYTIALFVMHGIITVGVGIQHKVWLGPWLTRALIEDTKLKMGFELSASWL